MLINQPAAFVNDFIEALNENLAELKPSAKLTAIQGKWVGFCLMGILMLNAINWAKFERAGLGTYKMSALSWMFRHSKIAWELLLIASVMLLLKKHGITRGTIVFDESDRSRSKKTPLIHKTYTQKDKATGGYVNGQTVVLLLLVTETLTFPVGFSFYKPDPAVSAWKKKDKRLKKEGVAKKDRPAEPARNPEYPLKSDIALELLQSFREGFPEIKVNAVLADALYGTADFMDKASQVSGKIQVVSQLRSNQKIKHRGKELNLSTYFNKHNQGVAQTFSIRGGKPMIGTVSSARLHVNAHGQKRFVIALKYEGETDYRYLVATDMTWRTIDIIQAYTLRWLVEVFFEDWKLYEGWGQEAKQLGEEGSSRSLILSLLFDHCLLFHPEQTACIENKQPINTVGSLLRRLQMEALLETIADLLFSANDIAEKLQELVTKIQTVFRLMPSGKHMSGRDLGRLEPTPSLLYRATG